MDKLSPGSAVTGANARDLALVRIATTGFFALGGFVFAGWAVRIPAVKEQVSASPATLGLALFAMTGSAVATMAVTGGLCRRLGSGRVTVVAAALLAVSAVLPTLPRTAVGLGLALLVFGVAYGAIDVAVNSVAVDLVAALRRPIMPSLHAANSLGSLAGAGAGGLLAPHLSPTAHMLLVAPLGVVAAAAGGWVLLTRPLPSSHRQEPEGDARGGGGRRLLPRLRAGLPLFAAIALCAAYGQGALDSWVPLHITSDLGGGEGVAAAGYAIVQGTMTAGRLAGVALLERLGQTVVVVAGGALACAGALVAALAPALPVVLVALAATGLGLANIFPVAIGRAGAIGGPSGVAFASTLGYGGILLAPPTIGFLAEDFGLPKAFTLIAVMIGAAAVMGYAARKQQFS
ncbi:MULTISPECIES: MFS transporter [Actinosynnema]|uniref:MFS transporter n=1 Tax=Actinosynnema TaxID=40566 RepID=UPI0020A45A4A|nr:MFS transporter [Actinosynnema pretiosum]MCP2098743.1 Fucose permease [Actinosynnema pretiosum]